jgi:quercetin dioxygenase-like cupin family protein
MEQHEKTITGEEAWSARSVTVLVGGDATGGRIALIELREQRGDGPPYHLHHWEDEIVYVLTGTITFFVGGARLPGTAGSCVLLPRGQEHSYRVESDAARMLVAVAPAGFEASYREVAWSGDATTVERLVAVAARYGVEVTGPPPGA